MEKLLFEISGFKCFLNSTFELNNLTVLTGANASGKSSLIQSLLLVRAGEKNSEINLRDSRFAFDMGDKDSLINKGVDNEVTFKIGTKKFYFLSSDEPPKGMLNMYSDGYGSLFEGDVYYLSAERQGPRYEVSLDKNIKADCGCHGNGVANAINNNLFSEIDESRRLRKGTFPIQLDAWLDAIFPGVSVKVKQSGETSLQVTIRNNQVTSNATNVGFGISYSLPIIVEGLLAKRGDWLIVENPEAHLHAKAQSNMGYFLAIVAAAGVRVLVETHSEHIVNGIRRAVMNSNTSLGQDDVNIYFMTPHEVGKAGLITIDKEGNLSDYPLDFFDQARQDLLNIITSSSF